MQETERVLLATEKENLDEQQAMIAQQLTAIREKKRSWQKMNIGERRQAARLATRTTLLVPMERFLFMMQVCR